MSNVSVGSTNATGTTFTVDSKVTAFQVIGGAGDDTLATDSFAFTSIERDVVFATTSIEAIHDSSGFYGNGGPNIIVGTGSDDNIQGGAGDDRLIGGLGTDAIAGGAGADTFVFDFANEGMDTTDFVSGEDRIEISAAGFGSGLVAGGSVTLVSAATADAASVAGLMAISSSRPTATRFTGMAMAATAPTPSP